jgi:plastocyanin
MTFRSSTFFSLLLLAADSGFGADVAGRVELTDSRLPAVARKKDFSGVVVWLEPVQGKAAMGAPGTHTILQKGKKFSPHVSVIPVGATVNFPNLDPIFHNAFSNFAGQPFDTGLYPPGGTQRIMFRRPGVVRVFCNIHSTMSAVIIVLDTPYYASSDENGSFRIPKAPAGEYIVKVWHERASDATLKALERRVTVFGETITLPVLTISESGYLQLPHKNKYGKDYGPEPAEAIPYGGK